MPRRMRVSKQRQPVHPLDVMGALAAASVTGCRGVPPSITLDDLAAAHFGSSAPAGSWGALAFDERHPKPCEALKVADVWSGRPIERPAGLRCGDRCLFAEVEG